MTEAPIAHRFDGKVAVVTGSSSGNGRGIALRPAAEGATVVCADLQPESARADVADGASVESLFAEALAAFGQINVVVPNAGISPQPTTELPEEDFDVYSRTVRVNQDGVWWTCREACRIMREQGDGGRIVLLASVAAVVGGTGAGAHYCMTKGAVAQLTRALAVQMGRRGSRLHHRRQPRGRRRLRRPLSPIPRLREVRKMPAAGDCPVVTPLRASPSTLERSSSGNGLV